MTMRITVLRDVSGTAYFIPNSSVTNVANKSYGWARPTIEVVFAPSVSVARAREALEAAARAASGDESSTRDLLEPVAVEGPVEFAASGVTWRLVARTRAGHAHAAKRAMIAALSGELQTRGFASEGSALVVREPKGATP
jgi:small-conductance mechanosensitive channel